MLNSERDPFFSLTVYRTIERSLDIFLEFGADVKRSCLCARMITFVQSRSCYLRQTASVSTYRTVPVHRRMFQKALYSYLVPASILESAIVSLATSSRVSLRGLPWVLFESLKVFSHSLSYEKHFRGDSVLDGY